MYSIVFFFFKQKTAYEMRISDWSSDVCSSDLPVDVRRIEFSGKRASGCRPFCRFLLFPQFRARLSACSLALWCMLMSIRFTLLLRSACASLLFVRSLSSLQDVAVPLDTSFAHLQYLDLKHYTLVQNRMLEGNRI